MQRKGIVRATNTHRFNMVLTAPDLKALDDFRRAQPYLPTRSAPVRRMIHMAAKSGKIGYDQ
jgi:hypothetical protein